MRRACITVKCPTWPLHGTKLQGCSETINSHAEGERAVPSSRRSAAGPRRTTSGSRELLRKGTHTQRDASLGRPWQGTQATTAEDGPRRPDFPARKSFGGTATPADVDDAAIIEREGIKGRGRPSNQPFGVRLPLAECPGMRRRRHGSSQRDQKWCAFKYMYVRARCLSLPGPSRV